MEGPYLAKAAGRRLPKVRPLPQFFPLSRPFDMKSTALIFTIFHLSSTWLLLVTAMRPQLAPVTFAGLRAAQTDLGMKPTPTPELSKRLIEDPAICGWVEGDQSKFRI